jgi:hypothetical protein
MTNAVSGVPVTLLAQFVLNGASATPELPITLRITPAAGGDPLLTTTSIGNPATGVYSYVWTPPDVDEQTDYIAAFDPSGDDIAAVSIVSVFPASSLTWATVADVQHVTGKVVTEETLALASSVISTFSGADVEAPADSITNVDRRHLKRATAWQAVWIPTKPGLITDRENAQSVTSDTQAIVREDRADHMLAPLARRELLSLSWVGTRSALIRGPRQRSANERNFLNEESDKFGHWEALNS